MPREYLAIAKSIQMVFPASHHIHLRYPIYFMPLLEPISIMSELTNLLNKLRQTAGLTDGNLTRVETQVDSGGEIAPHPIPEASERSVPDTVPTEANLLL